MERRRRAELTRAALARREDRSDVRFFAVPPDAAPEELAASDVLEPKLPEVPNAAEEALSGAAFRQMRARDRLRALLTSDEGPVDGVRPGAVFARPPGDLPALMGLAEQLEALAEADLRERALVWSCGRCATRYAIPVAALQTGTLRCERCGAEVDLSPQRSLGEKALERPAEQAIAAARKELAAFFREAMARGWPVFVSAERPP